ncbi:MAG: hypothetical protein OSJ54_13750 [Oscillospiraceae bacterium]|nr:hypothetical protein [Oscillospiraceae bacterium]
MSIFKVPENTNIEATAQRTDILHFMDVTDAEGVTPEAEGDTVWCQMGVGWTAMTESPSAQSKERKFINEKSKRKNITSYAPSIAFEALLMFLNPAIRKVYDIYTKRKTGTAAVVPMVTVDAFDTAVGGYYPARKGKYAVEVSSCDDDDDMIIKGNFNGQGDEAIGWFDPANGKWSDTKPTAQPSGQADTPAPESENE